jgi:hypothetical protein
LDPAPAAGPDDALDCVTSIMIRNGLYLAFLDGVDAYNRHVMVLRDGTMRGGVDFIKPAGSDQRVTPMTDAPKELSLRCRCGHVRGVAKQVVPYAGFRFVCYCRDCQAFARFLERPDVLDTAGGTDIFQMPTGRVKLTAGSDAVRCLHFSSKVFRWYTDCCRTPIGNTAGPRFPVIGLIHSFMGRDVDGPNVLGAPLCRIYERSAVGPLPPNAPAPPSLSLFALRAARLLGWWLRGLGRPNPFFDDETNVPLAVPRVITTSERATLATQPVHRHPGL